VKTEPDVTRIVRSWLHEDAHEDADRVLNNVLDRLDTTPQRRAPWLARRLPIVNRSVGIGLAAAAVVIAVLISIKALSGPNVGGPSVSETASPSPGPDRGNVRDGPLDPGMYTYADVDAQGFNVRFTVPAGWTWNGRYLSKGGIGLPNGAAIFFFGGPVQVYADPCHWAQTLSTQPMSYTAGPKVDALATQLSRNATTPTARNAAVPDFKDFIGSPSSIAGRWLGMAIELTVPGNINFADCDGGEFRSWGPHSVARSAQGPGQRDLVWAVDIGGVGLTNDQGVLIVPPAPGGLVIDAASFPGTPEGVMSEINAILDSMALGHWG
jgi:hypothetical protein